MPGYQSCGDMCVLGDNSVVSARVWMGANVIQKHYVQPGHELS